ncbi:hypothetical protein CBR_g51364 [Chara braunii]|uniref:DUF659 domain-containing protein n=1 Tax=Chara braunii TaxID=69332 RepID=A0A388M8F0_CHABU|nr:hypothetical protein CBR_g51364 [Chara braunii]|eukprot:GBG90858.1 hypothetical protein CBR_g51364 [Chara braunii]
MSKRQVNTFVQASDDTQTSMKKSNCIYKYVLVGQELSEKLRGQRMLRCMFCGNDWQGNRHGAARHFRSVKGCSQVTDEALMEMHYTSGYAFEGKWLELIHQYEELHGPWVDERRTNGGQAQARATSNAAVGARQQDDDVVDLDGEGEDCGAAGVEGEVEAAYSQRLGKLPIDEGGSNSGKRKDVVGATMQQGKKMRQPTIKEVFGSDWDAQHRKLWLRFVYNNQLPFNIFWSPTWKAYTAHFRDKPASVPMVWLSENEVASMDTVLETATDVVAVLKDIQEPFDRTGATIMSDGRKSRNGKPIVNFLAAGARGVMMYRTFNREGEKDDALAMLGRWISVLHDFGPDRVNVICTDSAFVYVKAGNALAHPHMRPEYRRITWLPCAAHVCNKLLSDIGTAGPCCEGLCFFSSKGCDAVPIGGQFFHGTANNCQIDRRTCRERTKVARGNERNPSCDRGMQSDYDNGPRGDIMAIEALVLGRKRSDAGPVSSNGSPTSDSQQDAGTDEGGHNMEKERQLSVGCSSFQDSTDKSFSNEKRCDQPWRNVAATCICGAGTKK